MKRFETYDELQSHIMNEVVQDFMLSDCEEFGTNFVKVQCFIPTFTYFGKPVSKKHIILESDDCESAISEITEYVMRKLKPLYKLKDIEYGLSVYEFMDEVFI